MIINHTTVDGCRGLGSHGVEAFWKYIQKHISQERMR